MGNSTRKSRPQPTPAPKVALVRSAIAGAAEVGLTDTIARNRACSPVHAGAIPHAPAGYQPTVVEQRRRALRVVAREQEAEVQVALDEIAANEATFAQDLGELAPDASAAKKLCHRLRETTATITALEALLQFHHELEDIALSDAVTLLEAAHREYEHRLDRIPQLATRYPALARFFASRSASISAGIARAKSRADRPEPGAPEASGGAAG